MKYALIMSLFTIASSTSFAQEKQQQLFEPAQTPSGLHNRAVVVIHLTELYTGKCKGFIRDPKFYTVLEAYKKGEKHDFAVNKTQLNRAELGRVATRKHQNLNMDITISGQSLNETLNEIKTPVLFQNEVGTERQAVGVLYQHGELEVAGLRLTLFQAGIFADDELGFINFLLPTPVMLLRDPALKDKIKPGVSYPFTVKLKEADCATLSGTIVIAM